jgi:hypothetical protein
MPTKITEAVCPQCDEVKRWDVGNYALCELCDPDGDSEVDRAVNSDGTMEPSK